jgi:fumarate reductase subunit C
MSAQIHPRYKPRLPNDWWLRHPGYLRYMLREMTCIPIGLFVAVLIIGLLRLGQGPDAWNAFLATLASPPGVVLQGIALAFATYHSITWFALAPRTMPLQIGARHVPGAWIAGAHYLAWAVISLVVLFAVGI